jgi:hypothetical protein
MDLHKVDQPYRDILVMIFEELDSNDNYDSSDIDDEDSLEDTEP